jgi:transposase
MDREIISFILPSGLLENFTITKIEELDEVSSKDKMIRIELEEKNQIPEKYDSRQYESKGFYPVKLIQDFPIRGKAVYLSIKRRRWRHKNNPNEIIHNDYSLIAEGSKLTQELSDFLKGTGRDPRRYH